MQKGEKKKRVEMDANIFFCFFQLRVWGTLVFLVGRHRLHTSLLLPNVIPIRLVPHHLSPSFSLSSIAYVIREGRRLLVAPIEREFFFFGRGRIDF